MKALATPSFMKQVRDFLNHEYSRRSALNPAYSRRAFARDLGVSPSQLCEVMSGRKNLSQISATRIGKKLGWTEGRNTLHLAAESIERWHWSHLCVLEFIQKNPKTTKVADISGELGISVAAIERALQLLVEKGVVVANKRSGWIAKPDRLYFGGENPSASIREFHREFLKLAAQRLEYTAFEDREFSSSILSLTDAQAQELRKRIRGFVEEISKKPAPPSEPTKIFGLALQLFKISASNNKEPK